MSNGNHNRLMGFPVSAACTARSRQVSVQIKCYKILQENPGTRLKRKAQSCWAMQNRNSKRFHIRKSLLQCNGVTRLGNIGAHRWYSHIPLLHSDLNMHRFRFRDAKFRLPGVSQVQVPRRQVHANHSEMLSNAVETKKLTEQRHVCNVNGPWLAGWAKHAIGSM